MGAARITIYVGGRKQLLHVKFFDVINVSMYSRFGWGEEEKYVYSVCVCVDVCCSSCAWDEVGVGGRGRGCQPNQKQERLIWPDNVDSVTNHSGL